MYTYMEDAHSSLTGKGESVTVPEEGSGAQHVPQFPSGDATQLWDRYVENDTPEVREELILHYAPLVKFVAGRVYSSLPNNVDLDDLTSQGVLGLISAVDNYDPTKGMKFEHYASIRIYGTIMDDLRANDWLPRTMRSMSKTVNLYYDEQARNGKQNPSDEETAHALNIPLNDVKATRNAVHQSSMVSLNSLVYNHNSSGEELVSQLPSSHYDNNGGNESPHGSVYENITDEELVKKCISSLTEDEQIFIALRYYENFSLKQIADILQCSETSCARKHKKILKKLKTQNN